MEHPKITRMVGGATLLCYVMLNSTHTKTGNTEHYVNGKLVEGISILALCKYAGEQGFYLFGCDEKWESVTDTFHDSIEDAKEQAEFEFDNVEVSWVKVAQ